VTITNKKEKRERPYGQFSYFSYTFFVSISDSTGNLTGTEATGAGVNPTRSAVYESLNALNVGLPGSVGTSVRVGNLDTEGNTLATIITLSHSLHLLSA
jgi:hypothetical protein